MDKTLVVGDVHISPNQNLRRATWLGRYINDTKPDRVVYIGDLLTFDSLSAWDKNKRLLMEGRRYQKDIESLRKFLTMVDAETGNFEYEIIMTEGNHEDREARYVQEHPEAEGTMDYKSLDCFKDWNIVPYKQFYTYKGIKFTHIPIMENGRGVSGAYCVKRALDICEHSVVFGHTHKLEYKAQARHGAPHLQEALNVGCYFEHIDEYAKGSVTSYWRGLVELDHYKHGRFKFNTVPMGYLKREYN